MRRSLSRKYIVSIVNERLVEGDEQSFLKTVFIRRLLVWLSLLSRCCLSWLVEPVL